MPISLKRIGNNGFGSQYKTEQNQNIDALEKGYNTLEQQSGQAISDIDSAQKQLNEILIIGKNLFNKVDITPESYLNGNTGNTFPMTGYFSSNHIRILASTSYMLSPADGNTTIKYYDINKNFISSSVLPANGVLAFTTPTNCAFVRFGQQNGWLNITQLELGSSKTSFEPYGIQISGKIVKDDSLTGTKFADASITENKLGFAPVIGVKGKNLFNKETVIANKYIDSNTGALLDNVNFFASDYITIEPSANYYLYAKNSSRRLAFYNAEKAYISFINTGTTFTTPANAKYLRYTGGNEDLNISQIEKGFNFTGYESFGNKVNPSSIGDNSLPGVVLKDKSLAPEKMQGVKFGKNLFNKNTAIKGKFVASSSGLLADNSSYFASDYIAVEPNTEYVRSLIDQMAFYTSEKVYISGKTYTDPANFTTPANCAFVRICAPLTKLDTFQLEKGNSSTSYEEYCYELESLKTSSSGTKKLLYTFNDACGEWIKGNKFPIAFFGDSTVDGVNTTGYVANVLGVDGTSPNAFSKKLETLLRAATNNSTLRIYNAGFSGKTASWGYTNIDAEFGASSAYNDVKMVGIGFGINDRLGFTDKKSYRDGFKASIKQIIDWLYAKNIQPFLLTTQAIVEPGVQTIYTQYPLRTSEAIESVANEVKRELAKEYGLQLIDVNKFTEAFLLYSSILTNTIISDRLHFGDIGHQYEADLLFHHLSPMSIYVDGYTKIDYSSQKIKDSIPEDWLTMPTTMPADGFKVFVNYTKADTTDMKIMTAYIFVNTKQKLSLHAFRGASTSTYVKVNGVTKTLTGNDTILDSALEMGLYKLEVFTGASTTVDFKGFIIQ